MIKKAKIAGYQTEYMMEGNGNCILLLHGWGANKESLLPIINHLKGRYCVVAPDLPGFGKTSLPAQPLTVDDYAQWVTAFLSALEVSPFCALGHSNGGRILIRLAGTNRLSLDKLVLLDSAGLRPKRGFSYYVRVYSYKAAKRILSLPPLKKTGLLEKMQAKAGSDDYRNAPPVMKITMSNLLNQDLKADLPHITASTLLIWGEADTATPLSDGKTMEKLIPGSGLVVLKGAGHFSYLDRFGQFSAALDYFLAH